MEKKYFSFNKKFQLKEKNENVFSSDSKDSDNTQALAKYLSLGYYIVTPLLVCVFFGLLIDRHFKSEPIGILFSIAIGTISTFYNLFTLVKNN